MVLPSLRKPSVEAAVVCDTSASIDDDLLVSALSEVDGMLRAVGTRSIRFLACDDAVRATTRVHQANDVVLFGGGGTDMGVGLAAAFEQRPAPDVVVVLTDGYTPWPEAAPGRARVIVAILGDLPDGYRRPEVPGWARSVNVPSSDFGAVGSR